VAWIEIVPVVCHELCEKGAESLELGGVAYRLVAKKHSSSCLKKKKKTLTNSVVIVT
jgi:hypothetical protein